jgi:hypothetical protein
MKYALIFFSFSFFCQHLTQKGVPLAAAMAQLYALLDADVVLVGHSLMVKASNPSRSRPLILPSTSSPTSDG